MRLRDRIIDRIEQSDALARLALGVCVLLLIGVFVAVVAGSLAR